jgi:hypothetical protein
MPEQKKMTVFTAKKDTPYIVDDELAQLLLDSRPEPEKQDVVTECARVFETMNIRTVKKEVGSDGTA